MHIFNWLCTFLKRSLLLTRLCLWKKGAILLNSVVTHGRDRLLHLSSSPVFTVLSGVIIHQTLIKHRSSTKCRHWKRILEPGKKKKNRRYLRATPRDDCLNVSFCELLWEDGGGDKWECGWVEKGGREGRIFKAGVSVQMSCQEMRGE